MGPKTRAKIDFKICANHKRQNKTEIRNDYLREESAKLLGNLWLNLLKMSIVVLKMLQILSNLSVSSNLDRFSLIPRVVQVLDLLEAEVPPADPVKVENPAKSLGRQARGEKPRHLKSEAMQCPTILKLISPKGSTKTHHITTEIPGPGIQAVSITPFCMTMII